MQLHKALTVGAAAVLVAGLLVLLPAAATAAPVAISGSFQSGTASFAGSTWSCTSGTASGTYDTASSPEFSFSSLTLGCYTPAGGATITLNTCTVPVDLTGTRTSGVDAAIAGTAAFGSGTCVKVSAGTCTANVQGTVGANFNETVRAGGWQDLTLNGSGILANQSGACGGVLTGSFTLNNIVFGFKTGSGTTTGIDFGPGYVGVNGNSATGSVAIDGNFQSGSASFAGSTYGCSSGTSAGTVARGAASAAADLSFSTLSVNCSTPVGTATFSLNSCTVPVDFGGATATVGVDTAVAPGTAAFGSGTCVKVSALFGACTANVWGTVSATFNETVRTGGWQDLILNGSGATGNQSSGCGGLLAGTFTLNNIDFGIEVTGPGINFV